MAALPSSPIVGSLLGLHGLGVNTISCSLNSGKHQCSRHSLVGWSSGSPGGVVERKGVVPIRAAGPKDESWVETLGTQFFKLGGGTKSEPKAASEGRSGTQFFGLGGSKKKKAQDEAPEEPKSGTQLFGFGSQKKKAGTQQLGSTNGSALAVRKGTVTLDALSFGRGRRVDPKTVFVAGATGQIGARIAQQLLRAGFNVRGGVPDLYVAQQLAEFASQYGVISKDESKRLNVVEFDFKNVSSIAKGLGNAGKVVVTVGPAEDGPLGKVSRDDALRVLEAATLSNAAHFVLVTVPGSGVGAEDGPLSGLAALFSRVFSKAPEISDSTLIDKIVETSLPYTLIKAASTDGADDYTPENGNLVVEAEGASDPSAKVSKIQVASVVSGVFQYTGVSENKSFEVASKPYAPSRPVDELLTAIQVDGRRAKLQEELARLDAEEKEREFRTKVDAEAREAIESARKAAQVAAQLEAEAKRLAAEEAKAASVAAKAQARADAAAASVDGLQEKAKELGGSPLKVLSGPSSPSGTASFKQAEKVKKSLFSFPKKQPAAQPVPASASPAPKSSGFLGGLFAPQETLYVDED